MRSFIICIIILIVITASGFLFSNYIPAISFISEYYPYRFGNAISGNHFIIIPSAIGFAFVTTLIIAIVSFIRDKFLDTLNRQK